MTSADRGNHASSTTGRVAIVTGAASGIGRAVALRLAGQQWKLAIIDVEEEGLNRTGALIQQAAGAGAKNYVVDVTNAEQVRAAIEDIAATVGEIAILVSNAGVLTVTPVLDLSVEQWRRTVDVNLTGSFICAQAAAREMVRSKTAGRIITVASVHSVAPGTNVTDYDASKGGLLMLTRSLARELAPYRITVNAVGPGFIVTNLGGGASEEYVTHIVSAIPLGRAGDPDEVAGAVSFLVGPDAGYITGALLVVDGGMLLTADL
jgi:NAD(P)-dependent dehydrogenase (short-subunit alcohol dehydrogenase family)